MEVAKSFSRVHSRVRSVQKKKNGDPRSDWILLKNAQQRELLIDVREEIRSTVRKIHTRRLFIRAKFQVKLGQLISRCYFKKIAFKMEKKLDPTGHY